MIVGGDYPCRVVVAISGGFSVRQTKRESPEVSTRHSHNAQFARGLEHVFSVNYVSMGLDGAIWCVVLCDNVLEIEGTITAGRQRH